jgi:hypothetical protein
MLEAAPVGNSSAIHVMDFRRRNLVLQWHALGGTWTACEYPPPQVQGVALISPTGLNICVYGQSEQLTLQIGPKQYVIEEKSPRIICRGSLLLFGLRRRFLVKSTSATATGEARTGIFFAGSLTTPAIRIGAPPAPRNGPLALHRRPFPYRGSNPKSSLSVR